jgi:hypothetical protein
MDSRVGRYLTHLHQVAAAVGYRIASVTREHNPTPLMGERVHGGIAERGHGID